MEIPEWKRWWNGQPYEEWAISYKWDHHGYGNHKDRTDPCEALAAVVKYEADRTRAER
jgi:hypothetical protein